MTPTYRFIFEKGTVREREFFPVSSHTLRGNGVDFRDTGEVRISRDLSDILIACSHDRAFFKILKQAYEGGQCQVYTINVDKFCKNAWTEIYEGEFTTDNCTFDFERCRVTIKPKNTTENDCISDGGSKEYNMFTLIPEADRVFMIIPDAVDPGATSGIQFLTTETTGSSGGTPPDDGYTLIFSQELGVGSGNYINLWGRQIFIVECGSYVPAEYIEVTACGILGDVGLYTTDDTVTTYNTAQALYDFTISQTAQADAIFVSDDFEIGSETYNLYVLPQSVPYGYDGMADNGILLTDLIEALIIEACPELTFTSEILKDSDVDYVSGGYNHWKNLVLFDVTDIKFINASENATKNIVTLSKLLRDLKDTMNLYWSVIGGVFIIEHISWWKNYYSDAIDLSYISGFNVVSFAKDNSFKRHEFQWAAGRNIEVVGVPIAYNSECTGDNIEKNSVKFVTDWYMTQNMPDDVPNEGLFLACCKFIADLDGDMIYQMKQAIGPLSNIPLLNGHVTWSYIHSVFHLHERSASQVYINGQLTTAASVKKSKQSSLKFQNKCFDIDVTKRILSAQGTGEIKDWSFNLSNNVITLNLLS